LHHGWYFTPNTPERFPGSVYHFGLFSVFWVTIAKNLVLEVLVPFRLGIPELLVILGIAVLIFGGKKIPELGKGLGEGIRNFKASLHSSEEEKKTPPQ
jgi:sec-independent protein translocase protein TatA